MNRKYKKCRNNNAEWGNGLPCVVTAFRRLLWWFLMEEYEMWNTRQPRDRIKPHTHKKQIRNGLLKVEWEAGASGLTYRRWLWWINRWMSFREKCWSWATPSGKLLCFYLVKLEDFPLKGLKNNLFLKVFKKVSSWMYL